MRLTEELLQRCEEFLGLIANEEGCRELETRITALHAYMDRHLEGWTKAGKESLAYGILTRLDDIWDCISEKERRENSILGDYFDTLTVELEEICGDRALADLESDLDDDEFIGAEEWVNEAEQDAFMDEYFFEEE